VTQWRETAEKGRSRRLRVRPRDDAYDPGDEAYGEDAYDAYGNDSYDASKAGAVSAATAAARAPLATRSERRQGAGYVHEAAERLGAATLRCSGFAGRA
jgi:hypothetical protein